MNEHHLSLSIHIGERDIQEWLKNEGKATLMPELLIAYEKLSVENFQAEDEIHVIRVEASIRGKSKAFDFYARLEEKWDALQKIYEWAIEEEEYEMCERIIHLGFNPTPV